MKERIFKKGKISTRRLGASVIAVALAAIMVFTMIPTAAFAATADLDTSTKYTESLGDNASTEYAGRVWNDKSVYTEDATFEIYGGDSVTIGNDSDFLIAYSALATSQAIKGKSVAPLDVVFVLDMSNSMSTSMGGGNRLYHATNALNDSMKKLLELNDYVRVGVVAFNSTAYEILPLDHYERDGSKEFFTCSGTTISWNVVNSAGTTINDSHRSSSGTNIQKGLFDGMNMLATEESTTATIDGRTVDRVPSLILLSDGQPSNASNYETWWNIANDTANMTPNGTRSVYGMKALMTASYMKDAIDRNYGTPLAKVYSIGVGIDDLSSDDRALAYATINPAGSLATSNETLVSSIRTAWNSYTESSTSTATLNGYTFRHPTTGYDVFSADDKSISNLYYVDSYYDVDDKTTMDAAFAAIVENIILDQAEAPTEITTDDPLTDGYIVYTDPIGEYMEFKEMKAILYAGEKFTLAENYTPTTDADGNFVYEFTGEVHSAVYGDQNLKNIIIKVSPEKDKITIMVPAALIPVRVNTVELNADGDVISHTNNGAYPIRVLYTVGLQDGVLNDDNSVTDKVSVDYIEANSNTDGSVNFYSNLYTGNTYTLPSGETVTIGNATAEFSPAKTNPFYYMQEDVAIYTDEECTVQATGTSADDLADGTTYYYKDDFYHETHSDHVVVVRTGKQLKATEIISKDGKLYRKAGTPRLNRMMEFEGKKQENNTKTASEFYVPTYNTDANDIVVYLGNNGVMSAKASGALEISKVVQAADGLTAPDKTFTFTVDLDGANGTYSYTVVDEDGNAVTDDAGEAVIGTVADGGTITLKDGQTARIINLPPGTKYEVTETEVAGFTAIYTGGEGTIIAGETSEVTVSNTYSVTSVTVANEFAGTKVVNTHWPWDGDDAKSFTFYLKPYGDEPLPVGYDAAKGVTVSVPNAGTATAFNFGDITYTEPGVYRYTVVEKEPENNEYLAGVTYSRAMYEITVTVTDDGEGKLVADVDVQQMYNDKAEPQFTYNEDGNLSMNDNDTEKIIFENVYDAQTVIRVPVALKSYTDNSGTKPLTDGMFQFKLKALTAGAPMPTGAVDGEVFTENEGGTVTFPAVTFTADCIPQGQNSVTFQYEMSEVIPAEATAENNYKVNGMTYDPNKYTIDVTVSYENGVLNVNAVYPNNERIVTFENVYTPAPTQAVLIGTKAIEGRDWLDSDDFTFSLSAVTADAPMPKSTEITVDKEIVANNEGVKTFRFGEINYTKPGVYKYQIKETSEDADGITVDKTVWDVTVTVVDDNGTLKVDSINYANGADAAAFVNKYDTEDSDAVNLNGTKILTGKDITAGSFYFRVVAKDGAPMGDSLGTNQVAADGTFQILKNVKYTEPGTYVYTVTESIPTGAVDNRFAGITYDDTVYTVTVNVTDNNKGKLVASEPVITINGEKADAVEFTNKYTTDDATIDVPLYTKIISGRDFDPVNEKFDFKMTLVSADPEDGIKLPENTTIQNDNEGVVDFEKITFTKPGTYVVRVNEVIPANVDNGIVYDSHIIELTFNVVDNGAGKLIATYAGATGETVFENKYVPNAAEITLSGEKILDGRDITEDDRFEFVIRAIDYVENDRVVTEAGYTPVPASRDVISTDGNITFGPIVYYNAGVYKYEIVEIDTDADGITYDKGTVYAIVTVTDDEKGQLHASVEYTKDGNGEGFQFINRYKPGNATIKLSATKELTGRDWFAADEFTFRLTPAGDTAEAVTNKIVKMGADEITITKDSEDKTASFGEIEFTEPGTYNFVIEETAGNIAGITYDTHKADVVVTVTDNLDGTMTAVAVPTIVGSLTFVNNYTPADAVAVIEGTKVLEGRTLVADEFEFELKAVTEGAPMPAVAAVKNVADGSVSFGAITYNKTGTYEYQITEKAGTLAGITYDSSVIKAVVEVTYDKATGLMVAEVDYEGASDENGFVFTNEYKTAKTSIALDAVKTVNASSGNSYAMKADDFTFVVTPADSNPGSETTYEVTNAEDGSVDLGTFEFVEPGDYSYTVQEVSGTIAGMSYDASVYTITVKVTDNESLAQLETETSITKGGNNVTEITFENGYDPAETSATIDGKKVLESEHKELVAGEFTFELKDADGNVIDTAENTAAGTFQFDAITYDKVGTYEYTVSEVDGVKAGYTYDDTAYHVTVEVTDEGGALKAVVTGGTATDIVFTNEYEPAPVDMVIKGYKVLTGRDLNDGEFEFAIMDGDKEIASASNDKDGNFTFNALNFTAAGTYSYTIVEKNTNVAGVTYDQTLYAVTVIVTDKDGVLTVESVEYLQNGKAVDEITFNNVYKPVPTSVQIGAVKQMEGRELTDNEFIFVLESESGEELIATNTAEGSVIFDAIEYDAVGNYTYKLYEVKGDDKDITYDDTVYDITVTVEDDLAGNLKATVEGLDTGAVFKNVYISGEPPTEPVVPEEPNEPSKPADDPSNDAPKTGDETNILLYILVALTALGTAGATVLTRRRRTD